VAFRHPLARITPFGSAVLSLFFAGAGRAMVNFDEDGKRG
jgi:hypothetical protein